MGDNMIFGAICTDPDAMTILRMVKTILTIAKIILPLIIIVTASIDFAKLVIAGNFENFKGPLEKLMYRLIAAVLVFFIPTLVNVIFGFIDENIDVVACFDNASLENIDAAYESKAIILLTQAEYSLDSQDYEDASYAVSKLEDGETKDNYLARLEKLHSLIYSKYEIDYIPRKITINNNTGNTTSSGSLVASGTPYSTGNGIMTPGIKLSIEPDPSTAINYWSSNYNYIDANNFIYPTDANTKLSLGAWPKNYSVYTTQLSDYYVYLDTFIFPVTPENGTYHFVYEHNGIDIMSSFGSPVYSPVDGTLEYSEWGHTVNKGSDETAYTVSIELDKPVNINGVAIQEVFLTHMSGIVYRCSSISTCNRRVQKGELLGFTGNAAGTAESIGWAPHLHMTLYPKGDYSSGLSSSIIQDKVYGLGSSNTVKAGGKVAS